MNRAADLISAALGHLKKQSRIVRRAKTSLFPTY
jgi:hypothetical protein